MFPCGSQPMSVGRWNEYGRLVPENGATPGMLASWSSASGRLPSTIRSFPSGAYLMTRFEPSSTVQTLSSLSTRTECAKP